MAHDNNEGNSLKPKMNGTKSYHPQSSFMYNYHFYVLYLMFILCGVAE